MLDIYFILYNLICIIMLLVFKGQMKLNFSRLSTENKIFTLLIYITIVLTVAETFACMFNGTSYSITPTVIQISNVIYYECFNLICFLWFVFVLLRLRILKPSDRQILLYGAPFVVLVIIILINPFTGLIFTINEQNVYTRNPLGIGVYWGILWLYIVFATIMLLREFKNTKSALSRRDLLPLIFFLVAPTSTGIIQSAYGDLSLMQLGLTLAIGVVCLEGIHSEVSQDALTGINNRHGLYRYLERIYQKNKPTPILVAMIDLNNLKATNDQYGHNEGDKLIARMAELLMESCNAINENFFLCRHGGDEFVIVGTNGTKEDALGLSTLINRKIEETKNDLLPLSASTGFALGRCTSSEDFEHLIEQADNEMYEKKKLQRNQ